jgi:hypothetical protein
MWNAADVSFLTPLPGYRQPGLRPPMPEIVVGSAVGNDGKIHNYFNVDNGRAEPVPLLMAATSA